MSDGGARVPSECTATPAERPPGCYMHGVLAPCRVEPDDASYSSASNEPTVAFHSTAQYGCTTTQAPASKANTARSGVCGFESQSWNAPAARSTSGPETVHCGVAERFFKVLQLPQPQLKKEYFQIHTLILTMVRTANLLVSLIKGGLSSKLRLTD